MRLTFCCAFAVFGRVTVRDLVRLDVVDRDPSLEPAIIPLAEQAILVLGLALFLAADGEHAVSQLDGKIFLVEAGDLGRNLHFFVGLAHLDVGPSGTRSKKRSEPKGLTSNPRKKSSNSRFISR